MYCCMFIWKSTFPTQVRSCEMFTPSVALNSKQYIQYNITRVGVKSSNFAIVSPCVPFFYLSDLSPSPSSSFATWCCPVWRKLSMRSSKASSGFFINISTSRSTFSLSVASLRQILCFSSKLNTLLWIKTSVTPSSTMYSVSITRFEVSISLCSADISVEGELGVLKLVSSCKDIWAISVVITISTDGPVWVIAGNCAGYIVVTSAHG